MLHVDKIYLIHLHTKIIHTKRSCDDFNLYICFFKTNIYKLWYHFDRRIQIR